MISWCLWLPPQGEPAKNKANQRKEEQNMERKGEGGMPSLELLHYPVKLKFNPSEVQVK